MPIILFSRIFILDSAALITNVFQGWIKAIGIQLSVIFYLKNSGGLIMVAAARPDASTMRMQVSPSVNSDRPLNAEPGKAAGTLIGES